MIDKLEDNQFMTLIVISLFETKFQGHQYKWNLYVKKAKKCFLQFDQTEMKTVMGILKATVLIEFETGKEIKVENENTFKRRVFSLIRRNKN